MSLELSTPETEETDGVQSALRKYQCRICSRRYKRREHLSRHATSHTAERAHRCNSCNGAFQRADVLKRHVRTCNGGNSRSGARRRACDRCVRLKKACSSHDPCECCSKKGIPCYYSAVSDNVGNLDQNQTIHPTRPVKDGDRKEDPASSAGMTLPFGITSEDLQAFAVSSLDDLLNLGDLEQATPSWPQLLDPPLGRVIREDLSVTSSNHSLYFLGRITNNTGLVLSFECGTQDQREQIASALEFETLHSMNANMPDQSVPPLLNNIGDSSTENCFPMNWLSDPLSMKTHEILLLIQEVVTIKPRNSAVTLDWSAALKSTCLQFFSPSNLRRFLGMYWAIWHPNVNFVHRPTFDPVSAKPALLAAMALIGKRNFWKYPMSC